MLTRAQSPPEAAGSVRDGSVRLHQMCLCSGFSSVEDPRAARHCLKTKAFHSATSGALITNPAMPPGITSCEVTAGEQADGVFLGVVFTG